MSRERKRGKLSMEEMNFLRRNCLEMSVEEMAKAINRTEKPVRRFLEEENLRQRGMSDDEHLLLKLRDRYYYKELKKQFSVGEMEFFEHQWIDYFKQFGEDVIHSEEMQIIEVTRTEILINRGMVDRQEILTRIERLEEMINEEMDKPDDTRDTILLGQLETQLGAAIGSKSAYIQEHEKLLTKKEKSIRDLKGTRDQRKKNADDAKVNFSSWLRQLQEEDNIKDAEFEMEIHRIAADKSRKELSKFHAYEDGEVDRPLFNAETVEDE